MPYLYAIGVEPLLLGGLNGLKISTKKSISRVSAFEVLFFLLSVVFVLWEKKRTGEDGGCGGANGAGRRNNAVRVGLSRFVRQMLFHGAA